MLKGSSVKNYVILFALILSGCARVNLTDAEFCGDMGIEGAECFNLLSDQGRSLNKKEWDDERFGMICTQSETFTEWKSALIKLCNATRRCRYDYVNNAIRFDDKLTDFREYNENLRLHRESEREGN